MQGILYEESSIWLFLLVTVVLGGGLAWMTGRACAETWRSAARTVGFLLILGAAVRFAHFALFEGTLLSLRYYVVDTIVVGAIGLAAWRVTRAGQMAKQYWWLYERDGLFSWKERAAPAATATEKS
jgi:small-conductance mechanosensitive channel